MELRDPKKLPVPSVVEELPWLVRRPVYVVLLGEYYRVAKVSQNLRELFEPLVFFGAMTTPSNMCLADSSHIHGVNARFTTGDVGFQYACPPLQEVSYLVTVDLPSFPAALLSLLSR
ncbi:hypothetical protein [Streptomyces levis]|uniref:hypothetical protein n=1 Tax=Streptomyces levis TaxID=285566 RepID=UPI0031D54966